MPEAQFRPGHAGVDGGRQHAPISEVNIDDEVATTDPVSGERSAQKVTVLHGNRDRELTDVTVSSAPADRVTGQG